jgi:hypothetical protein
MGTAFALGWQRADERRQEREQLQSQQRQAELQNLANSGLSPQDMQQAIALEYQKDPNKVKQWAEGMIERLVGRKPQQATSPYPTPSTTMQTTAMPVSDSGVTLPAGVPVTVKGPAPRTRQEAIANLAAKGKTKTQQATENTDAQQDAQLQGTQRLMQWYQGLSPDQQKIAGPMLGVQSKQDWKNVRLADGSTVAMDVNQGLPPGATLAPTGTAANQTGPKIIEAGGVPYGVSDPKTGQSYYANQMNDPNTPPEVKQVWGTIQGALTKKQQEADKKQAEIESRFERSLADRGTWNVVEGAHGETELLNSKTGEMRDAPSGLHKSGYYAKQIAPLDAASMNIDDYVKNGVFDGPGDLSLQHEFFTATQPSTGFRMTKVQQDILQNSQNWLNSWKAKVHHATTGTWFSDKQRQQIAKAAQDAINAKKRALQGTAPQGQREPASSGSKGLAPRRGEVLHPSGNLPPGWIQ